MAIPVQELAQKAAGRWIATHLPTIDHERQVKVHILIRPGAADLTALFARKSGRMRLSNDTSCGVGFAPLSRLERMVYAVEEELGAAALASHPEIGRDIKVMGIRQGEHIHLTIACALVSKFVASLAAYLHAKKRLPRSRAGPRSRMERAKSPSKSTRPTTQRPAAPISR